MLSYPAVPGAPLDAATIAAECGKLVLLDRILVRIASLISSFQPGPRSHCTASRWSEQRT